MVGDERKGGNTATWRVIDGAGENAAIADSDVDGTVQKGANMPRKRNALGRGLSALMSASAVSVDAKPAPAEPLPTRENTPEGGLIYLSIDRVLPNKKQPRQHFVQADIDSLAESIRKTGLLQPIVVRRRSSEPSGQLATYEIVAGERRFRAAKQAGLVKIPALLRQLNDRETLEIGIVENVQRSDLNPVEEALAYQRLSVEFDASQAEIAEKVGKDRVSVANSLRLLKLPEGVRQLLINGKISAGHGRAILMLDDVVAQAQLAERIQHEGLSVRGAERMAAEWGRGEGSPSAPRKVPESPEQSASVQALEERLRRALGTKVKLSLSQEGKGDLRVTFFSNAELERILEKLGA